MPPTLLADVAATCEVSCQEVFGPVDVASSRSTRIDEAIARVNSTPYGLATGFFTNRLDFAMKAVRKLDVGGVHINETSSSRVDLMPYGGTKDSRLRARRSALRDPRDVRDAHGQPDGLTDARRRNRQV